MTTEERWRLIKAAAITVLLVAGASLLIWTQLNLF